MEKNKKINIDSFRLKIQAEENKKYKPKKKKEKKSKCIKIPEEWISFSTDPKNVTKNSNLFSISSMLKLI